MQINIIFFECVFIPHLALELLWFLEPLLYRQSVRSVFSLSFPLHLLYCDVHTMEYSPPPLNLRLTFSKCPPVRKRKSTPPSISYSPPRLGALCKLFLYVSSSEGAQRFHQLLTWQMQRRMYCLFCVVACAFFWDSASCWELSTFILGFDIFLGFFLGSTGCLADLWNALTLKETWCCRKNGRVTILIK